MKRRGILLALSLFLTASLAVGCGSAGETTSSSDDKDLSVVSTYEAEDMSKEPQVAKDRKDTIVVGAGEFKGNFNTLYAESTYDTDISWTMFERTIIPDEKGEAEKRLLKDYTVSEDGLTYTFTLKDDLVWSDGTPITSEDVAFPFYVMADASYDGPQDIVNGTYSIVGVKDYHDGKADTISGIEIVDDKTVKFTCDRYYPFATIDLGYYSPLPKHYYEKFYKRGDCSGLKSTFTSADAPVSGAYKLTDYKKGQEVVCEANDKFFLGKPKTKNVIFKYTTTDNALSMVKSGETDMDRIQSNNDNIDDLESTGFLGYINYPGNNYSYLSLNQTLPQFQEKEVRQALTIGLNRKKIVETVYDKYANVINIPESSVCWTYKEPKETYDYDMDRAKQMLDDAGWKVGEDGIREKNGVKLAVHLMVPTGSAYYETLLSVIDKDWKELGVDYTGEQIDFNTLVTRTDNKDFEAYCMVWSLTAIPGGDTLFPSWGSQNYNTYKNDKIDELSKKISAEHDKDKLKELYGEYYDELNEDLPYIYLQQANLTYAVNGRVKGIEVSSYVPYYLSLYKAEIAE